MFRYFPKSERPATEKEKLCEVMVKIVTSKVLVGGDFNGHADLDVGGFREFMWGLTNELGSWQRVIVWWICVLGKGKVDL